MICVKSSRKEANPSGTAEPRFALAREQTWETCVRDVRLVTRERTYSDVCPRLLGAVPNLAIFGRPIEEKKLEILCINKLILNRVAYDFHFGPASVEET